MVEHQVSSLVPSTAKKKKKVQILETIICLDAGLCYSGWF
jgi:hypothetical protein